MFVIFEGGHLQNGPNGIVHPKEINGNTSILIRIIPLKKLIPLLEGYGGGGCRTSIPSPWTNTPLHMNNVFGIS